MWARGEPHKKSVYMTFVCVVWVFFFFLFLLPFFMSFSWLWWLTLTWEPWDMRHDTFRCGIQLDAHNIRHGTAAKLRVTTRSQCADPLWWHIRSAQNCASNDCVWNATKQCLCVLCMRSWCDCAAHWQNVVWPTHRYTHTQQVATKRQWSKNMIMMNHLTWLSIGGRPTSGQMKPVLSSEFFFYLHQSLCLSVSLFPSQHRSFVNLQSVESISWLIFSSFGECEWLQYCLCNYRYVHRVHVRTWPVWDVFARVRRTLPNDQSVKVVCAQWSSSLWPLEYFARDRALCSWNSELNTLGS